MTGPDETTPPSGDSPSHPDPVGLSSLFEHATTEGTVDLDKALPIVYQELRAIAANYVKQERPGHTLQPTALTHEAYLRLRDTQDVTWKSRAHLIAIAARAMRHALVDHARARRAQKRGGGGIVLEAAVMPDADSLPTLDLLELDRALEELGQEDERKLGIVEMLYFGGLTTTEAADVLGVSRRTVERDWRFARAWLLKKLHPSRA
ncbi:MAG: sigma-70 family RNA polymerase sigma factor [Candidatus Eisenbacteria bacterium]